MPKDSSVVVHRDRANMPGLSTWVTSFCPFSGRGGRLWVFDLHGNDDPPSETRESIPPGARGSFKTTYHRW
eukprot:512629-Amphidinium_carterae.1